MALLQEVRSHALGGRGLRPEGRRAPGLTPPSLVKLGCEKGRPGLSPTVLPLQARPRSKWCVCWSGCAPPSWAWRNS